jgi:hypothetical protein
MDSVSITHPQPALNRSSSAYQVPRSFYEDHYNVDEYTRSAMASMFFAVCVLISADM